MIFSHHGDAGDVVYQLMATQYLCEEADVKGTFYLCPKEGTTRVTMTKEHAENILPLIRSQSYIGKAEWREKAIGLRIDTGQRIHYRNGYNLADQTTIWLGLPESSTFGPWLTAEPKRIAPVIFSRSARYHGRFPWREIHAKYAGSAIFLGTTEEHYEFEKLFGAVPYYKTKDLLEVAEVIAGCSLFVGNQSCPRAIAEGLKVPVCVEQCVKCLNTHFLRANAWYDELPPDILRLNNYAGNRQTS